MKVITVYGQPQCPQCEAAKLYLETNEIPFKYVDISVDDTAKKNLIINGHRSVPQFYLDGKQMINQGWAGLQELDIDWLKELLKD